MHKSNVEYNLSAVPTQSQSYNWSGPIPYHLVPNSIYQTFPTSKCPFRNCTVPRHPRQNRMIRVYTHLLQVHTSLACWPYHPLSDLYRIHWTYLHGELVNRQYRWMWWMVQHHSHHHSPLRYKMMYPVLYRYHSIHQRHRHGSCIPNRYCRTTNTLDPWHCVSSTYRFRYGKYLP